MKQRWREITLVVPHLWDEILPHFLQEMGFSGLWIDEEGKPPNRLVLRTYLPEKAWEPYMPEQLEGYLKELSRIFGIGPQEAELGIRVIDEEDWASKWLPFFQPLKVGFVWIRPSRKSVHIAAGEQEIVIDPGQAFGTGHHETTRLCLESILQVRPFLQDEASVLDLGTGSGILAMFAAKVGFRNILALDIDRVAVETALRNIKINRLEDFIRVSNEPLESIKKRFGLILANLSFPLLENLAKELRLHLVTDGRLVVSGILTGETDELLLSLYAKGLELTHQKSKNDWECLILRSRVKTFDDLRD
jgi:ribosomal protein L11 methyltransferase